jgi:hypothetical protein
MKVFGECLREEDLARVAVERERFELDVKRLAQEKIDREEERKIRREELAAHQEQEMEKFKLIDGSVEPITHDGNLQIAPKLTECEAVEMV